MAIRIIRKKGDDVLKMVCRPVIKFDERLHQLLDDMKETMVEANGVGIAAPQVGVVKRAVIVQNGEEALEMINPVITKQSGSDTDVEGCLSVPNVSGMVERPTKLTVEYQDRNGNKQILDAEGFFARIVCHETDHLNGILFIDKAVSIEHQ